MSIAMRDVDHIFERLRSGTVPERGLETFAVGIEGKRNELGRQLKMAASGEGGFKFLRGGYGCGKTFMARLAVLDAQAAGFATSFVVVSDNDLKFYRFDELYRKIVQELSTSVCPRGALADVLDRWVSRVEEALIAGGADEDAADFDERVQARLTEELESLTRGKAPDDMARALRRIFALKQEGKLEEAGALISWLSGSENVGASIKARAGLKGDIDSSKALDYLHGVLEIVKAAGYKGLVIVVDEVETILRARRDTRGKSLNGLRQLCDAAASYRGLLWIFTGTEEFFDSPRGVAGLEPLHKRIGFSRIGAFSNPRQPQLELTPFDAGRLRDVALKLRALFPSEDRQRLHGKVSTEMIDRLVAQVTAGFKGDVGVVPRQFLRKLVDVLDLVEQEPDFDPARIEELGPVSLSEAEERARTGAAPVLPAADEDDDAGGYEVIEF